MTGEPARMCACGHDDLTHALPGLFDRGRFGECYASLPAAPGLEPWECRCPEFAEAKTAAEIRAAQEQARAQLRAAFGDK